MRVKLLVAFLAWGCDYNYCHESPRACRFLLPSERLTRVSPGVVMDANRRLWRCPDSFLEGAA